MAVEVASLIDNPYAAIVVAAAPSVASGLWICWQARTKRVDERMAMEMTREDRRAKELDQQQSSFSAEQSKWFADLRQENRDLRAELIETRRDRDRGWNFARWWHGTAHELLRMYRNLRHNAVNMQQWIAAASARHSDLVMPKDQEPIPDRPELPMSLEEGGK